MYAAGSQAAHYLPEVNDGANTQVGIILNDQAIIRGGRMSSSSSTIGTEEVRQHRETLCEKH